MTTTKVLPQRDSSDKVRLGEKSSSADFLKLHFSYLRQSLGSDFYIEIRFIKGKKCESKFLRYHQIAEVGEMIQERNQVGWDVFFGVNPRPLNKQKKEVDIKHLNCLWVDIDVSEKSFFQTKESARKVIRSFPWKPSCLIDSGGGYHCYWYLDSPFEINSSQERIRLKQILSGLINSMHADKSGKSLERVMRLPGTINHKYGKRCEVVEWNNAGTSQTLFN